jgi:hypothetical protein
MFDLVLEIPPELIWPRFQHVGVNVIDRIILNLVNISEIFHVRICDQFLVTYIDIQHY